MDFLEGERRKKNIITGISKEEKGNYYFLSRGVAVVDVEWKFPEEVVSFVLGENATEDDQRERPFVDATAHTILYGE